MLKTPLILYHCILINASIFHLLPRQVKACFITNFDTLPLWIYFNKEFFERTKHIKYILTSLFGWWCAVWSCSHIAKTLVMLYSIIVPMWTKQDNKIGHKPSSNLCRRLDRSLASIPIRYLGNKLFLILIVCIPNVFHTFSAVKEQAFIPQYTKLLLPSFNGSLSFSTFRIKDCLIKILYFTG